MRSRCWRAAGANRGARLGKLAQLGRGPLLRRLTRQDARSRLVDAAGTKRVIRVDRLGERPRSFPRIAHSEHCEAAWGSQGGEGEEEEREDGKCDGESALAWHG
jgi:hypothetical protein